MTTYLDHLRTEGRNPDYIRTARRGLQYFGDFLIASGVDTPTEISREKVIEFQAWCSERVASGAWLQSTSIQVLKKARAYINWLSETSSIDSTPWENVRVGTVVARPRPLSSADVERLFEELHFPAGRKSAFASARRTLIVTAMLVWGIKASELASMALEDVEPGASYARAPSQKESRMTLPMTPEIRRVLRNWRSVRTEYAVSGVTSLLISRSGSGMTPAMIALEVSELGDEAGVEVSPQRLRDTCAVHLIESAVPLGQVQRLLGHGSLQQTVVYVRSADQTSDDEVYESVEHVMDRRLRDLL